MSDTAEPNEGPKEGVLWQFLILFAAAAFSSLDTWVSNPEGPSLPTAAAVAAIFFAVALLLRWILVLAGLEPRGATYGVALFVLVFANGGNLIEVAPLGRVGTGLLGILVGVIAYRLRDLVVLRFLISWGAIALLLTPLLPLITSTRTASAQLDLQTEVPHVIEPADRDVLVLVADAYPSNSVLQQFYQYDNSGFTNALEDAGFSVDLDAQANYSATLLSVPSVMQMEYVVGETILADYDLTSLFRVMGGDGALAQSLQEAGYTTVYVESGWLGTQCSDYVDECVEGPWPDETFYDITFRSLLRNLPGFETGLSFSRGALHSMDWLQDELAVRLANGVPELIYVHLLAPHPPLFLNSRCEWSAADGFSGFAVGIPEMTAAERNARIEAYVAQVECVNSILENVAGAVVAGDGVAVFFGDHGPDIGVQLFLNGDQWTDDHKRERFLVMYAGYGSGCDFGDIGSLVNVGRRVLNCVGGLELDDLDERTYVFRRGENGSEVIETVLPSS